LTAPNSIAEFYDHLAPDYDRLYAGRIERAEDAVLASMLDREGFNRAGCRTADLGCGTGLLLRLCPGLAHAPLRYVGVDLSPGMIERFRAGWPKHVVQVGDMREFSIAMVGSGVGFTHVASLWCASNYVDTWDLAMMLERLLMRGGRFFVMALMPGCTPVRHTSDLNAKLHDHSDFPAMLGPHFEARCRPFAREWNVPERLGRIIERAGTMLPVGWGRHRYVIYTGRRL
jgi:SAM-dependent methyltransferase